MRHTRTSFGIASTLLLTALAACEREPAGPSLGAVPPAVRTAPTTVTFGGKSLTLETSLWRDFMPGANTSPDGSPLIAGMRIHAAENATVPTNVQVDSAWVILGDQAWAVHPVQEQPRGSTAPYFEVVARDGPKWGPNVRVDVTVRLNDGAGHTALLRAPNQLIGRTD